MSKKMEPLEEAADVEVSHGMGIREFLATTGIHKYTVAYLEVQFRGIIKTEAEWKEILKEYMEGKK